MPRLLLAFVAAAAVSATVAAAAPTDPVDLFVAGTPSIVNNYRIPALVQTSSGTLVVVAEARSAMSDCDYKWLVGRRSTDNGATWSPIFDIYKAPLNVSQGQTAGNPVLVWVPATNTILLHFSIGDARHCNPTVRTMQIASADDGQSWQNATDISASLGRWAGATPGPGTGAVVSAGPHAGRIIIPAHYGPYEDDVTWYSDDNGGSWTLSSTVLPQLDEVVVAPLPNGSVILNARTAHLNKSCDCRATSVSNDGGVTWSLPYRFDPTLIEPICQASLVSIGPIAPTSSAPSTSAPSDAAGADAAGTAASGGAGAAGASALFFSNPASTSQRANITIRRSDDGGLSWRPTTWRVDPNNTAPVFGGYSCIAPGTPIVLPAAGGADRSPAAGAAATGSWGSGSAAGASGSSKGPNGAASKQYGAIVWERTHQSSGAGSPDVISFALFPLDLQA